jgi:hypothetical protein
MKKKFFLFFILLFLFFNTYAQETQIFKSKDSVNDWVNVLTVTKNADGSINVNRSKETNTAGEEVALYNLIVLSHEMDYYWIIPFDDGDAARSSGAITFDCDCAVAGDENGTGAYCAEELNVYSGKVTCQATSCANCNMTFSSNSKSYPNTGGYLIIEATAVTIE